MPEKEANSPREFFLKEVDDLCACLRTRAEVAESVLACRTVRSVEYAVEMIIESGDAKLRLCELFGLRDHLRLDDARIRSVNDLARRFRYLEGAFKEIRNDLLEDEQRTAARRTQRMIRKQA